MPAAPRTTKPTAMPASMVTLAPVLASGGFLGAAFPGPLGEADGPGFGTVPVVRVSEEAPHLPREIRLPFLSKVDSTKP